MTPSILVDLVLRDLASTQVDQVASNIKARLESTTKAQVEGANRVRVADQQLAADRDKMTAMHARAIAENTQRDERAAALRSRLLARQTADEERMRKQLSAMHARAIAENTQRDERAAAMKSRLLARQTADEERMRRRMERLTPRDVLADPSRYGAYLQQRKQLFDLSDQVRQDLGRESLASQIGSQVATRFGIGALIAGGMALGTKAVKDFVQTNLELETTFARVNTVIQGSASETAGTLRQLRDIALDWGRTHSESAKEVGQAMYNLLSAGLSVAEAQKSLPAVLALANAGFLDQSFAAETVATAYEVFGKQGESMVSIVNKIQQVAAQSQVTVEQLAGSFTYLTATADLAGISFDEISAALGTLANVGLRGEKAGRNLSTAISQLIANQDKLEKLGIKVKDLEGNFRPLLEILEDFRVAVGSRIDAQEQGVLRDLLGEQGIRAFAPLIRNLEDYKRQLKSVSEAESASFDALLKNMDTVTKGWEIFTNRIVAESQKLSFDNLLKFTLAGPTGPRGIVLTNYLLGEGGGQQVRAALQEAEKEYERFGTGVLELRDRLREQLGDIGVEKLRGRGASKEVIEALQASVSFDELDVASTEQLEGMKTALRAALNRLADELTLTEDRERFRKQIAGSLSTSITAADLKLFEFTAADVGKIRADARAFFMDVEKALVESLGEVGMQAVSGRLSVVRQILAELTDDKSGLSSGEAEAAAKQASSFVRDLQLRLVEAQLNAARAIPRRDIQGKLMLIDQEFNLNLQRNVERYEKTLESIPEKANKSQRDRATALAASIRRMEDDRARTQQRLARFDIELEGDVSPKGLERLQRDLLKAHRELGTSLESGVRTRLQIIDDDTLAKQEENFERYTNLLKDLQREFGILFDSFVGPLPPEMEERRRLLEESLKVRGSIIENQAFLEKDRLLREQLIDTFERQLDVESRLQQLQLKERGFSASAADTNRLARDRLLGLANQPLEGRDDRGSSDIGARSELLRSLQALDATSFNSKNFKESVALIERLGPAAGFSETQIRRLIEALGEFETTQDSFRDVLSAGNDALLDFTGLMERAGNAQTWKRVSQGLSGATSAIKNFYAASEFLDKGKGLMAGFSIASGVFGAIGTIISLFDRVEEKQRNVISAEDYKYSPGRNVSPEYGKAQTINVQVDMNPNFNFLEPSQLGPPTQRRIAFELGDDFVEYLQTNGWLPRR